MLRATLRNVAALEGVDDFAILEPEEFEANQRETDGGRNKRRNHQKYCVSSNNV